MACKLKKSHLAVSKIQDDVWYPKKTIKGFNTTVSMNAGCSVAPKKQQ
jgi:hypothetical protein